MSPGLGLNARTTRLALSLWSPFEHKTRDVCWRKAEEKFRLFVLPHKLRERVVARRNGITTEVNAFATQKVHHQFRGDRTSAFAGRTSETNLATCLVRNVRQDLGSCLLNELSRIFTICLPRESRTWIWARIQVSSAALGGWFCILAALMRYLGH